VQQAAAAASRAAARLVGQQQGPQPAAVLWVKLRACLLQQALAAAAACRVAGAAPATRWQLMRQQQQGPAALSRLLMAAVRLVQPPKGLPACEQLLRAAFVLSEPAEGCKHAYVPSLTGPSVCPCPLWPCELPGQRHSCHGCTSTSITTQLLGFSHEALHVVMLPVSHCLLGLPQRGASGGRFGSIVPQEPWECCLALYTRMGVVLACLASSNCVWTSSHVCSS